LLNRDTNLANNFSLHVNNENNIRDVLCDDCDKNEPYIFNHDISEDKIRMVITNLARVKSPGIDGIVYELYMHSTDILIEPICKLFNVILSSGGSRCDVKNVCGIFWLCSRKKVLQKY